MTTPTPDEITAAVDVLRRAPGVAGHWNLDQIEQSNAPRLRLARDLIEFERDHLGESLAGVRTSDLANMLDEIAARHGLRITTDPGELIQYRLVRQVGNGHILQDAVVSYAPSQGGLDAATEDRAKYVDPQGCGPRIAAMYLLSEGGRR